MRPEIEAAARILLNAIFEEELRGWPRDGRKEGMRMHWRRLGIGIVAAALFCAPAMAAETSSGSGSIKEVRQELERLRQQREQDRQHIEALEQKLEKMEQAANEQKTQQEKTTSTIDRILPALRSLRPGGDRFVLTGYGSASYQWNDNENTNTFLAGFNPIFLFRPADWVLFESELEVKLPSDSETEVNLEYAQADISLTDYLTVVGGKTLLPFGEFIERLHPAWVNKLVTHPLPFREGDEGGILPFSDIGAQARGAVPLGYGLGTNFDYTVYIANGPRFSSEDLSASFVSNNEDINRGKAFGARIGLTPLPLDENWGRLRIGASTYNGEWDEGDNLWLTSWGLDGVYQYGPAELRGEYLTIRRDMPQGQSLDKRDGWYVQGAYKLSRVGVPYLDRTECVVRYSGQNQREAEEGIAPHPRQVALGIDYAFTPSVVWKLEYDRDMPRNESDNNQIQTQVAVGF